MTELNEAGVAAAVINTVGDMFEDPDTRAGLVAELPDGTPQLRTPVRLGGEPLPLSSPPPRRGQHTEEITAAVRGAAAEPGMSATMAPRIVDGPFLRDGLLLNRIGGEWTAGSGDTRSENLDPATGQKLVDVVESTEADATAALRAAAAAQPAWAATSIYERAAIFRRAAGLLRDRARSLATMLTLEEGKPLPEALGEVVRTAETLEVYAGLVYGADRRGARRPPAGRAVDVHADRAARRRRRDLTVELPDAAAGREDRRGADHRQRRRAQAGRARRR